MIRQYFMDANYWAVTCRAGYPMCQSTFAPSGVLVKAVLLHSGRGLDQYFDPASQTYQPFGQAPDYRQGYGRATLKQVLPLRGVYTSFDLFVADQVSLTQGASQQYAVQVTDTKGSLK